MPSQDDAAASCGEGHRNGGKISQFVLPSLNGTRRHLREVDRSLVQPASLC